MRTEGLSLYALAAICLLLQLLPPELRGELQLQPGTLWQGEYWRLVSGHFVHAGWGHWWLNVLGIVLLQQLFGRYLSPRLWLLCCAVGALVVSAGLGLLASFSYYLGFSGILHALFTFAALAALRRERLLAAAVLAVLLLKTLAEQLWGPAPASAALAGIAVATDAHWLGLVAGAVVYGTVAAGVYRPATRPANE